MFLMNMINFGANLKINDNIYNKLSSDQAKNYVQKTVNEYKEFIEYPKIKKLTSEDTIELRRAKYREGYALELKITNPSLDEPYITGVYTNKNEPTIKSNELVYQTLLYLCFKSGEKPRLLENSFRYINRVLFDNKLQVNKNC